MAGKEGEMAQKQKRSRKARGGTGQGEPPVAAAPHAKERTEKVKKEAKALLEKIDALLHERQKGPCAKSHVPHVHLCDGTKMDLRKMFK